jgi:hypothetical protein
VIEAVFHATTVCVLPSVHVGAAVGADGTDGTVVAAELSDHADEPIAFVALIWNTYWDPVVRPVAE